MSEGDIYINADTFNSPDSKRGTGTKPSGSSEGSERRARSSRVAAVCLGLLCVFLLAARIGLCLHYHMTGANLTEERDQLQASYNNLTEQRDQLLRQRDRLRKRTCAEGWRMFSCSCYFLSTEEKDWVESRQDCRDRGADLVIIDSNEEQTFIMELANTMFPWIGLSDREEEGTWTWVDGTPLTTSYWCDQQPDNGAGDPVYGEEDCGQIKCSGVEHWNDFNCARHLNWICEKEPE